MENDELLYPIVLKLIKIHKWKSLNQTLYKLNVKCRLNALIQTFQNKTNKKGKKKVQHPIILTFLKELIRIYMK